MRDLKEKAAYLRGLVEGANFIQDEKQKVIWDNLTEFCNEMAENMAKFILKMNPAIMKSSVPSVER